MHVTGHNTPPKESFGHAKISMPFLSTQWFRFSTRQSKYTRRTNTSIQWMVAKLTTCLPSGWNINLPDRRTCNCGSCLKVVFCFNGSNGWLIYLSVGYLSADYLSVSHPDKSGRQRNRIACGSGDLRQRKIACGNRQQQ